MSAWTVGDYQFDANRNRVWGRDREVQLEPKAAALLAYFCEHPGRNIGRDELLRAVWHGQVVSDNSINRVVVLLRKALGDDKKVRAYIATVPKVGYRFIADVTVAEREAGGPSVAPKARWALGVAGVVSLAFLALALMVFATRQSGAPDLRSIAPLSRLAIVQSSGAQAYDGRSLLYTASDGQHRRIYLVAGPGDTPTPISPRDGDADFATWAHDDAFVVYQFSDGDRCEFHRLDRSPSAGATAEVIYECVPGSYSELSLALDDKTLFFLERATPSAPYAVYALDLEGNRKRRLSQPVARGYGNHYVDVHPRRGTLLLLSDHLPGKTSVFELDPVRDSFTLRTTFAYGLDSAIWSHRQGYIVHPSRHPSYELLETSLDSEESSVLISDSRRISSPRRLNEVDGRGGDYLFTSYLYNRDIETTQTVSGDLNSAVMDYLPALSSAGRRLAFVSKRAGYSQIWIKDVDTGRLSAIEAPDRGRRFLDLRWSANGQRLLANTNTGVLVYAVGGEPYLLLHDVAFELPAYAVRWRDAQTLSFSHYENGRWQAYEHSLETGQNTALDARWAFSVGDRERDIQLDQSFTAWHDGQAIPELARCASPVWRYQLRWRFDGQYLYCHADDARGDLLRFDQYMEATRLREVVERFEFFSVGSGEIAKTSVASSHSDIMRTRGGDMQR